MTRPKGHLRYRNRAAPRSEGSTRTVEQDEHEPMSYRAFKMPPMSLQEEASATARHPSYREAPKLRHYHMTFVAAGSRSQEKDGKTPETAVEIESDTNGSAPVLEPTEPPKETKPEEQMMPATEENEAPAVSLSERMLRLPRSSHLARLPDRDRVSRPAATIAAEVLGEESRGLFTGRAKKRRRDLRTRSEAINADTQENLDHHKAESSKDRSADVAQVAGRPKKLKMNRESSLAPVTLSNDPLDLAPAAPLSAANSPSQSNPSSRQSINQDGYLEDYISNLRLNGELEESSKSSTPPFAVVIEAKSSTSMEAVTILDAESPEDDDEDEGDEDDEEDDEEDEVDEEDESVEGDGNASDSTYQESSSGEGLEDSDEDGLFGTASSARRIDILDEVWSLHPPPTHRKTKHSRRKAELLGLEDSELGAQLYDQFEKDRMKKKARKAEKARDRALATQFSVSEPQDMESLRNTLLDFMFSDSRRYSFPPLDNMVRKSIHMTMRDYGIDSNSKGPRKRRILTISKPRRWAGPLAKNRDRISDALDQNLRKYGMEKAKWRKPRKDGGAAPRRAASGGFGFRMRDGEVVGEGAPEIGVQNKGRLMLERLGWSQGTALGATNNKGLMLPIAHTVKTSKAGLG